MNYKLKQVVVGKTFRDEAIDLYTDEVYNRFKKIDIKYPYNKFLNPYNTNAGKKGEAILEPITDISMWMFSYSLWDEYSIIKHYKAKPYTKREGIDYRILLLPDVIDFEAKNLDSHYTISKAQFDKDVLSRYDNDPSIYRALLIQNNHANKIIRKWNTHNINLISIPYFMCPWSNNKFEIRKNIAEGIEQFTNFLSVITNKNPQNKQSIPLADCIDFGMPYKFIEKYHSVNNQTIKNMGTKIGAINRNDRYWGRAIKYRRLYL